MKELYFVMTVTERQNGERIKRFLEENHISIVLSTLGHGTAANETLDLLGLEATEKTVLFALVPGGLKKELMHGLLYKLRIDTPGAGVALSIPIDGVAGGAVLRSLLDDENHTTNEEKPMKDMPYALVAVIANSGCTDLVMDAARSADATGGTVLHVKGAGASHAEKFFGMSIAAEKELVLIVTEREKRNGIMKAIVAQAGQQTEAHAVCFSLPVDQIAGFSLMKELKEL